MKRLSRRTARALSLFFMLTLFTPIAAQQDGTAERFPRGDYISPMPMPIALSGSFGSIRSRHFHSGTDMRTSGVEGEVVRAVAAGNVVRINVSTSGYGNCIYVQHAGGVMSVYGHLQAFAPHLEAYIRDQQYAQQKSELELYPAVGTFPVAQADLLGWSGNTGSSGGPHLHFELRLKNGTLPYNSYLSGVSYDDATPPTFKGLYLYHIDEQNYEASLHNRRAFTPRYNSAQKRFYLPDTLVLSSVAGLGVEVTDIVNSRSLTCNISALECFLDQERIYHFDLNAISFDETSYADGHVDYAFRAKTGRRIHLLFQQPGNLLSRYQNQNRGLLTLADNKPHPLRIRALDAAGNAAELHLVVKGSGRKTEYKATGTRIAWKSGGQIASPDYHLFIPAGALFADLLYQGSVRRPKKGHIAPEYTLHNENVALRKAATFTIPKTAVKDSIPLDKLYLARWDAKKKEYAYYGVPKRNNKGFVCNIRDFGRYTLLLDTVAPRIVSPRWDKDARGQTLPKPYCFALKVADKTTAVRRISSTIDGQWALWEFEPKTGEIWHQVDSTRMPQQAEHRLRLILEDAVGNRAEYTTTFR